MALLRLVSQLPKRISNQVDRQDYRHVFSRPYGCRAIVQRIHLRRRKRCSVI